METLTSTNEINKPAYGAIRQRQPGFSDQAIDTSRQGLIRSAGGTTYGLGADTSISGNVPKVETYTEQEALARTMLLIEEAATSPNIPEDIATRALDIYENLSFIGERELAEAARSIAEYWKAHLDDNPGSSIFIVTNKTFATENEEFEEVETYDVDLGHVSTNKSDDYILDKVLGNFNDEELLQYGSRLIFSASDLAEQQAQLAKVIVLDDWIMSGQQMRDTLDSVFENMTPKDIEINLVACSEDRLIEGFMYDQEVNPIPIRAHFTSRKASHPYTSDFGGAYLTAAHSSGDYPFEGTIEEIVSALNQIHKNGEVVYMPPLTNIIRPYYSPEYRLRHMERLRAARAIGRSGILSTSSNYGGR